MVEADLDTRLGHLLARGLERVLARARWVAVCCALLTLLAGVYAGTHLGVNTDHTTLISPDLPFRQYYARFAELFPILDDTILVVVDGETPELTREATERLADRLAERSDAFRSAFVPGGGPFFERNALLFLDVPELEDFADHMALMQPVLAELERDQSIGNLAQLVSRALKRDEFTDTEVERWPMILDRVSEAMVSVYLEYPIAISWESFLLEGSSIDPVTRKVIVLDPVLDTDHLLPAGRAMETIRETAAELGLEPERGVTVRITGNPALNHEEMLGLFWDVAAGGVFCFFLVAIILWRALRSVRLAIAAILTLLAGLVWTACFAAATVGHINLVSIAFAVLFIGLGVDFAIHLGMRYSDVRCEGLGHGPALRAAVRDVGGSLVLCTVSTSIGFYVFVPTDNRGVAELGLISGTGMLIILLLTLTLFPALIELGLQPARPRRTAPAAAVRRLWRPIAENPRRVLAGAALVLLVSLLLVPRARFEANVVQIRDPGTESVETMNELLADADASPWYVDVLAPSLDAAGPLKQQLEALPVVRQAIAVDDFVPADQEEKLEILEDVAFLMDVPPPMRSDPVSPLDPQEQVEALRELYEVLDEPWLEEKGSTLAASVRLLRDRLGEFLAHVEGSSDPSRALANLETVLLGSFPDQLRRLDRALKAEPVDLESLPPELTERMLSSDGQARIQAFPEENVNDEAALEEFVDGVRTVWPDATGLAVNFFEFGRTTSRSMREALLYAAMAISLLLWLLWRSPSDTLLVMAPLALGACATTATMVALDMHFNFVNVVVLPLLLGIGVDSGIHLVHRSHTGITEASGLLASTTARAVFFSAMTTLVSFGSLALSDHQGMHSMGVVLMIGIVLILASNLIVLPALITVRAQRRARRASSSAT